MIVVVYVALLTGHVCVAGCQRKINWRSRVISVETRIEPTVECPVTALAGTRREIGGILGMGRIGGVLPVLQVARLTFGGETVENSRGRLLVAVFALNRGMSAKQREAVLMILHLLRGDGPSLNGMALLTV